MNYVALLSNVSFDFRLCVIHVPTVIAPCHASNLIVSWVFKNPSNYANCFTHHQAFRVYISRDSYCKFLDTILAIFGSQRHHLIVGLKPLAIHFKAV